MDHTGGRWHTFYVRWAVFYWNPFIFVGYGNDKFFRFKSLYFECYATMPMFADAHISSFGIPVEILCDSPTYSKKRINKMSPGRWPCSPETPNSCWMASLGFLYGLLLGNWGYQPIERFMSKVKSHSTCQSGRYPFLEIDIVRYDWLGSKPNQSKFGRELLEMSRG